MSFSDNDAQRLIDIIDERIERKFREHPQMLWGVVATAPASNRVSVYLYGETVNASEGFVVPEWMQPEVGDLVRVRLGANGDRYVEDVYRASFRAGRLRLTSTTDATLGSTGHAFQVGADSGPNLVADDNEIISRNNGSTAPLHLNAEGGQVRVNANAGTGSGSGIAIGPTGDAIFEESAGIIGTLATFFAEGFRAQEAADAHAASDSYTTYAEGLSWFIQNTQSASGWPTADGRGVVITLRLSASTLYHYQFWLERGTVGSGDSMYWRSWNSGTVAWNAWVLIT